MTYPILRLSKRARDGYWLVDWTDPDTRRRYRVSTCTTDERVADKVRLEMSTRVNKAIQERRHALATDHGNRLEPRRSAL